MNNNNDKLFFSIFRNIYIFNNILKFLKIYNFYNNYIFNINEISTSIKSIILNHPHKYYFRKISIGCDLNNIGEVFEFLSSKEFPENIESVTIEKMNGFSSFKFQLPLEFQNSNIKQLILPLGISIYIAKQNSLPKNLKILHINQYNETFLFNHDAISKIIYELSFSKLKSLTINTVFEVKIIPNSLPNTLEYLNIKFNKDMKIEPLQINSLPNSLIELEIELPESQNLSNNILPRNLETLSLVYRNTKSIQPNELPLSLKKLKLLNIFNFTTLFVKGSLPESLSYFKFGGILNQPLSIEYLPSNLKIFKFLPRFKDSIARIKLQEITMKKNFSFQLDHSSLPQSLTKLELPSNLKINNDNIIFNNKNLKNFKGSIFEDNFQYFPKSITNLSIFDSVIKNSRELFNHFNNLNKIYIHGSHEFNIDLSIESNNVSTIHLDLVLMGPIFYFIKDQLKNIKYININDDNTQPDKKYFSTILENSKIKKTDVFQLPNFLNQFHNLKILTINSISFKQIKLLPTSLILLETKLISKDLVKNDEEEPTVINSTTIPLNNLKYLIIEMNLLRIENPLPESLESIFLGPVYYLQNKQIQLFKEFPNLIKIYYNSKDFSNYIKYLKYLILKK